MKWIRNIIAFVAVGGTLFLASCAKEDNNSATGDDRSKFTGTWTCAESSQQQGNSTYSMTIVLDPASESQVIATNFYALGSSTSTYITISGNNMTVSSQHVQNTNTTVSGTGSYSNGNLTLHFSADDGQTVDQVTVN